MTPDPLSPRAQALLDAARDGLGPDAAAIARMRANVLAGAGGVGVAAGSAKAGMSLGAKLTILAVVAGALGAGGWWLARDTSSSRAASASASASVTEPAASAAAHPSASASASAAPGPVALSEGPKAPSRRARSSSPSAAPQPVALSEGPKAPSRRARSSSTSSSSLADEVALVDDAMTALRRDDARAALAAADDHVARFGRKGQLAEEASAIRVESLCRLGDARWSSALDDFDSRFPRSAQRPRLTSACKGVQ